MGYAQHYCRNHFTAEQISRMRMCIANDHWTTFNTIVKREVYAQNVVNGQTACEGNIRISDEDGNTVTEGESPIHYDLPLCVKLNIRTMSERLPIAVETDKHQTWNRNFSDYKLMKELHVLPGIGTQEENAVFAKMNDAVITAHSESGQIDPTVSFRDPWYLESTGYQPGNFNSFSSPHHPTGAFNKSSGGIFLFEPNPDPETPLYGLQIPRYLDENHEQKSLPLNIGDNVAIGLHANNNSHAVISEDAENPDIVWGDFSETLTRSILFLHEDAEIVADYKAHRCTVNNYRPTTGNSQRRIAFDDKDQTMPYQDIHRAVYESAGQVYCITSEDGANTWLSEVKVSDDEETCINPAIAIADNGLYHGSVFITYVDIETNEVVVKYRLGGDNVILSWSELDRITVATPELCHPAIASEVDQGKIRVVLVWEDINTTVNQVQTNVLKYSIYECDQAGFNPKIGPFYDGSTVYNDVVFRDLVFAEGRKNWRGQTQLPQYPSVVVKEPYPTFGVMWTEGSGNLLYDDITWEVYAPSLMKNATPSDLIPASRMKAGTAPSLCVQSPPGGRVFVAYQGEDGWSQWPCPTTSLSWPITLAGNLFFPVTSIFPLWPLDQTSQGVNPSRVYVRGKDWGDDTNRYNRVSDWNTISRVLNYRTLDQNMTSPSIGSQGEKLRVAVNDGFGAISIANHDDLHSQVVYTNVIEDGFDPSMTVEGSLALTFSLPASGLPSPLTQSLHSTTSGLTKASRTTVSIENFMRELTVRRDTSFAVYGMCLPNMLKLDSTRLMLGWEYRSLDTLVLRKDAAIDDFMRTTSFDVEPGAAFEYATELYSRYVSNYEYEYDFILQFCDSESDSVLRENRLSVTDLPTDSAWYVVHRVGLGDLSGRNIYARLRISDTSSVYELDVADVYDVPTEVSKQSGPSKPASATGIRLWQNYPNPFNPNTTITFSVPFAGRARLTVFNSFGALVKVLVEEEKNAGTYSVQFDAVALPSGVYFYKLESNGEQITRQMTLLK